MNEKYGRSPATEGLGTIMTLNHLNQDLLVSSEKTHDPPTYSMDDSGLGGGVINKSAGADNPVRMVNGKGSPGQMIGPIYTVGDMKPTQQQVMEYRQAIELMYFMDLWQDEKNERMTGIEYTGRAGTRMQALGSMITRITGEVLDPSVERVANIL